MRYEFVISDAAGKYHSERELTDPPAADPIDLTAFVSCYNEAQFIVKTLDEVCDALSRLPITFEIIVIDDCSSDNSAALVRQYIADHPQLSIILKRNLANEGLAQNYIEGAFIGKGRYYKLFCGDNTEPVESITQICGMIGKADMVIPNYDPVEGKSAGRMWLSRLFTGVINLISGNRVGYYNGLAVHLRRGVMRWHPNTRGFGFQADIICMLVDKGASYVEVTVPNVHRGTSSALTFRNWLSVLHTVVDILIRRLASVIFGR